MAIITELSLRDWKSYSSSTLFIDQLSVLIGTNAGGKSNALDALIFLHRVSTGSLLTSALQGDNLLPPIRGGLEWASKHPAKEFALVVTVKADDTTDYKYEIHCNVAEKRCDIVSEQLVRVKYRQKKDGTRGAASGEIKLFRTDPCAADQPNIVARLYNEKQGTPRQSGRSVAILSQISGLKYRQEINEGVDIVLNCLRSIFILDPIPSHMRGFSPLSDRLEPDAGNIAGVVAALPEISKRDFEKSIQRYIRQLPEREIGRVYAETVGKFKTDAMLYFEENWTENTEQASPLVDSRGMSDGTLRFLAILTALLTRPQDSLLVIEEVDNGLHPSRSNLLLRMLQEIGKSRHVDVLITTHNPALLDAMGTEMVPFITVVHRNQKDGSSQLTLLEDVSQLPKLLSFGTVGKVSSKGLIEKALRGNVDQLSLDLQ